MEAQHPSPRSAPPGFVLVSSTAIRIAQVLLGYIALALTVLAVFVGLSLGTNHSQNGELASQNDRIEKLVGEARENSLSGCLQNNRLREQSNLRIPAEQVELRTALAASELTRQFNVATGSALPTSERVRELLEHLEEVPLRDCKVIYGMK